LEHGVLARIANVDRASKLDWAVHQADHSFHEVVDVAKTAGLSAIAIDGDRLATQRLHNEIADHASVVRVHARTIGVEDTHHLDLKLMLAPVVEEQRLGAALALVVATTDADRIYPAPVAL